MQHDTVVTRLHAGVFLVVANHHALVSQVIAECVGDLVVEERQKVLAGVDEIHLQSQVREDRRVLTADDAGAVEGDGFRREIQAQDGIAVADPRVREIHVRWMIGPRPGGYHEVIGAIAFAGSALGLHLDGMLVDETRMPGDDVHVVAVVEALAHGRLLADHRFGSLQ